MILYDLQKAKEILPPAAVAFGNFDGVHLGHQALIRKTAEEAKQKGLASAVFTFRDLPVNEICRNTAVKKIQTTEEKLRRIETLGIDYIICVPFDTAMQTMSPEAFASEIAADMLHCKEALCGFNFSFGFRGAGDSACLKKLGEAYGFETYILPEYTLDGQTVSSTLLRRFLEAGDMQSFARFSGKNYEISGTVMSGQHLGKKIGFPTVNLSLENDMSYPRNGVYASFVYVNNAKYKGITNIGNKPTVGNFSRNAETHIFGFDEDLYGSEVRLEFLSFLRPEKKFENLEELKKQIAKDCENALHFHSSML